jgi:hypothetical protein
VYVNSDCEKMHGDYRINYRVMFLVATLRGLEVVGGTYTCPYLQDKGLLS